MLCCPFINIKDIFKNVESKVTSADKGKVSDSNLLELTPNQKEDEMYFVKTDKSKKK